ncbi:MAG: PAS domain-containing protein [Sphingomonas sp.]|nr:PAS domain-containing protein [Sphingomonas sp.]
MLPAHFSEADAFAPVAALPAAFQCDLADDALTWAFGVYDIFGIPRGERVDRREVVEMYTQESRELLDRLRSEAIASCGSFTFEAQIRRTDGALRWMRVSADVASMNGRATVLYGVKQDITAEVARGADG